MRNQTGINENSNQVLTPKKQNALQAGRLSPSRGRCPKDREGLLIIMKNKDLWRNIIQVVVSILTAALTALGTTSCMKLVS